MRRWFVGTAISAVILVATLLATYFCRRGIAAALTERCLAAHGITAAIQVARLDLDGVGASVRLGTAASPDAAGTIDASIAWAGLTPAIRSLRITSARVQTRFDGRRLSLGAGDDLLNFLSSRPPSNAPPDINVEGARAVVETPSGRLELTVDAALKAGRLQSVQAQLLPGELQDPNLAIRFRGGTARVESNPDGLDVQADLTGRFTANAQGTPARLEQLHLILHGSRLKLSTANGFDAEGQLSVRAEADNVEFGRVSAEHIAAVIDAPRSSLARSRPIVATDVNTELQVQGLNVPLQLGAAVIPTAEAHIHGDVQSGAGGPEIDARADLHLGGELSDGKARQLALQVPLLSSDANTRSILTKALRSVEATVAGVHATYSPGHIGLTLEQPLSLIGGNGVRLTLEPQALLQGDTASAKYQGAFKLALQGGGGPTVSVAIPSYTYTKPHDGPPTIDARWNVGARLSVAPLTRLALTAGGTLRAAGGTYTVSIQNCAHVTLAELALGQTDLAAVDTQLCDAQAPWLVADAHRWTVHSLWRAFSARLPAANTTFTNGTGRLDLSGDTAGLNAGQLQLTWLQLADSSPSKRFAPLSAQGNLILKGRTWTGALDVGLVQNAHPLGRVGLRHSLSTGSGEARIQVSALEFANGTGGLQPSMLSPLLQPLARAHGRTGFDGTFSWASGRLSSHGTLRLENWGFSSPAGEVTQVNANVELTSLLPLQSAPHQLVSVGKIDAVLPLTQLSSHFELLPTALTVEDSRVSFADGIIMLGPATVPFDPKATLSATVRLQDIDLNDVVAATSLGDRLKLDVHVSGTIPFSKTATDLEVTQGFFASTGPGRIEISRRIWSADTATDGNAIRDFAYQALEHLAVDQLDGTLNSLPEGRLGVVLHVRGHHDPPVAAPTRIGILAFLRGHAFDHPLPLPKGTPIDLTLDSSLNFEGLLDTWRAASSAVHP